MNNWRRINYWAIAKPSECYMFADSWLQSFDHVAEWDHWYSLRHGPSREFLNIMFSDGHSESTLEADIVTAGDSMPYGVGTPWWGGAWD